MIQRVITIGFALALSGASFAAVASKPTPVTPGTVMTWDTGAPRTYTAGDLTLSFRPNVSKGHPTDAVLTIAKAKGPTISYPFAGGLEAPSTQFAVGRLDAKDPSLAVIIGPYSGGAHCCLERKIFVVAGGKWKVLAINFGENSGELRYPADVNGDGVADFVLFDDNFAYQFGCYACSWLPPRIFVVRGGVLVDVSASRKYDAVFRDDLVAAKKACTGEDKDRGLCAGVAADGARLGAFAETWRWVLKNYPHEDNGFELPEGCQVATRDGEDCPDDKLIKYATYPEALAAFLKKYGYITEAQQQWAVAESKK